MVTLRPLSILRTTDSNPAQRRHVIVHQEIIKPCFAGGSKLSFTNNLLFQRYTHLSFTTTTKASPDDTPENSDDPSPKPSSYPMSTPSNSEGQTFNGTRAIPLTGIPPTAGATFVLAGFLKILIVFFPFSTMAISMYLQGRADLGAWAAFKMLPIAVGILALAKTLVDKKVHRKKWGSLAIVLGSVLALVASRWLFARPRPSPLDPAIHAHRQHARAAALDAERKREQMQSRVGRKQQGGGGGSNLMTTSEEARKLLESRSKGGRFDR